MTDMQSKSTPYLTFYETISTDVSLSNNLYGKILNSMMVYLQTINIQCPNKTGLALSNYHYELFGT